jgi:hypothetical protein
MARKNKKASSRGHKFPLTMSWLSYFADIIIPTGAVLLVIPIILIISLFCFFYYITEYFWYAFSRFIRGEIIYRRKVIDSGYSKTVEQFIVTYKGYTYIFEPNTYRNDVTVLKKRGEDVIARARIKTMPKTMGQLELEILYL